MTIIRETSVLGPCLLLLLTLAGKPVCQVPPAIAEPLSASASELGGVAPFIENLGQWDDGSAYRAQRDGLTVWARSGELWLQEVALEGDLAVGRALRLSLDALAGTVPRGSVLAPGVYNFFLGSDRDKWVSGARGYGSINYRSNHPGVDLEVSVSVGGIKLRLLVDEGYDLSTSRWHLDGAGSIVVGLSGEFLCEMTSGDPLRLELEVCERSAEGGVARAAWTPDLVGSRVLRFLRCDERLDEPVVAEQVVSDINLEWSTFFGGLANEIARDVLIDASGDFIITGGTAGPTFPTTPGPLQFYKGGLEDIFVSRIDPSLPGLVYSSLIGGNDRDHAERLAQGPNGTIAVVGWTDSNDFATTPGALDQTFGNNGSDAVVIKLRPDGSQMLFSTYLGGPGSDLGRVVHIGEDGQVTVAGETSSTAFPTTDGVLKEVAVGFPAREGFVSRLMSDGSSLVFSTLVGGSGDELVQAMMVLDDGRIMIAGATGSSDFPATPGAYAFPGAPSDVFVGYLSSDGSFLDALSIFGGDSIDSVAAIDTDSLGRVYVVGFTSSSDLPTSLGAFQDELAFFVDGFAACLSEDLSQLEYLTYFGDTDLDGPTDLTVGASGVATVIGVTLGGQFPTTPGALSETVLGTQDGFALRLTPRGDQVVYSTTLGGGPQFVEASFASGVAAASHGSVVVVGSSSSLEFPVTADALKTSPNGGDVFLSQISMLPAGVRKFGASAESCLGEIYMGVTKQAADGDPSFGVTCSGAPPLTSAALSLGFGEFPGGGLVLPGFIYYLDVTKPIVVLLDTSDAAGYAEFDLPLPAGAAGVEFFLQYIWVNTAACGGLGSLSASNALAITVQ